MRVALEGTCEGEKLGKAGAIKNPVASRRGMEEDLLPNRRFGLQFDFFAASSGECTPTRFNAGKSVLTKVLLASI
jgi:hypothetical protein